MNWTLRERAAATPCPAHGRRCPLAGRRGLMWTWLCGITMHADDQGVRRLIPLPASTNPFDEEG